LRITGLNLNFELLFQRFLLPRSNPAFGHATARDSVLTDGLWDVYNDFEMGHCAENTARVHNVTREDQDAHAIESYKRATRAWEAGVFTAEVVPIPIKDKKGNVTYVKEDEAFRKVVYEKIPTLKPVFQKNGGTVTAANASDLNDGASAVVLMSVEKAKELGVKPLARIVCEYPYF
jgi:acetyl-CoA C-acetyltransferase